MRVLETKTKQCLKKMKYRQNLFDLSFNQKSQNIIGMQIADLVAYPIGKWVLDNSKEIKLLRL